MRMMTFFTWTPENTEAVYRRFEDFHNGKAPEDVKQAFGRLKVAAWEKLMINGVVSVSEGDEIDLMTWHGYWQDLGDFELAELCFDLHDQDTVSRITPPSFMRK